MVFSSIIFLWALLPVTLLVYFLLPGIRAKNIWLTLVSLFFYAWGEPKYVFLMIFSVILNWGFGLIIAKWHKWYLLGICVAANLSILGYFKYYNLLARTVNRLFSGEILPALSVVLPVGISFYTFQALSYVIDVYRGDNKPQKNLFNIMLYVALFPQLIAGPIVKYHDIEEQIGSRQVTADGFCYGIKRFIFGLGKKVILANSFANVVDKVLEHQISDISQPLLALTTLFYMMQIYFDFSGYSDMAIGLGKMFGFTFEENFKLPYVSLSVREFWRRWHISLSGWFREYVYIPLGGNRKGTMRTYINLAIVFFLTGFWHGAGWNFIFWGLFHGFFMILERGRWGKILNGIKWKLPKRIYTLAVVYVGWIFFRIESMRQALSYFYYMLVPHTASVITESFVNGKLILLLAVGIFTCGGFQAFLEKRFAHIPAADGKIGIASMAGYMLLLWTSLVLLVNNTYNPFIYFRF